MPRAMVSGLSAGELGAARNRTVCFQCLEAEVTLWRDDRRGEVDVAGALLHRQRFLLDVDRESVDCGSQRRVAVLRVALHRRGRHAQLLQVTLERGPLDLLLRRRLALA